MLENLCHKTPCHCGHAFPTLIEKLSTSTPRLTLDFFGLYPLRVPSHQLFDTYFFVINFGKHPLCWICCVSLSFSYFGSLENCLCNWVDDLSIDKCFLSFFYCAKPRILIIFSHVYLFIYYLPTMFNSS